MWPATREGTSSRLYSNYIWRHSKFNFTDFITKFKILKIKQKVIQIFRKIFQLMRQEEHGYQINWKQSILKILSLWPFCVAGHIYVGEDYTSRSQHTKGALFPLNHGYAKRTLRNDLLNDVCLLYRSYKINYVLCKNKDVIARRRVSC